MTTIRRLVGILAIAAAAWWSWSAWRGRSRDPSPVTYANEWGIQTRPLTRAELAIALEEERAIARRLERFTVD